MVLVTGAAGFLGGHLVDALVARGAEVRALVRPVENASRLHGNPSIEVVHGDLTDVTSLQGAVRGVQRVYNIAARTGPWGLEVDYWRVNVRGLADLVQVSLAAGVRRIVHTSSITVYGHHLHGLVTEDNPLSSEDNPYSRSKIAGEKLLANLVQDAAAPVVIIRPGWIYGPRDSASFARFVALVKSGRGFILGSGRNILPVVYVQDVVQGLIRAGDAGDEVIGRAYTIVNDQRVTQAQYLNTIADCLGVPHVSLHLPYSAMYLAGRAAELTWRALGRRRAAPPPVTTYGVTLLGGDQAFALDKARTELGYMPEYDLARGVAEGVRWFLEAQNAGRPVRERRQIAGV